MITDITNEIKNEKDRELYVQFRNVLDNMFLNQIKFHEKDDHLFHECELISIFDIREEFPKMLMEECKRSGKTPTDIITYWLKANSQNLLFHLCGLVVIQEEYNKRVI